MPEVKDGKTYTITFNTDPMNATGHCEVVEMPQSLFGALDDHDRRYFKPGEKRTELIISERQAQSLIDELSIQGLSPSRETAKLRQTTAAERRHAGLERVELYVPHESVCSKLQPPPNVHADPYALNRCAAWAVAIGCLVLAWAVTVTWMVQNWR